jgi:predicted anti-sigma-YlaC factor YlaD
MSCRKFERIIYLYEESDPSEKKQLHLHMETCGECRELFNLLSEERPMISKFFPVDQPDFPGALTERIVAAVKQQKEPNVFDKIFREITFTGLRYTCASISAVMLVAFVLQNTEIYRGKPAAPERGDGVQLKSARLLENVLTDQDRGESLFATIKKRQPAEGSSSTF